MQRFKVGDEVRANCEQWYGGNKTIKEGYVGIVTHLTKNGSVSVDNLLEKGEPVFYTAAFDLLRTAEQIKESKEKEMQSKKTKKEVRHYTLNTHSSAVAFLNFHKPGWFELINLDKLDMKSVDNCILGQLFGGYQEALMKFEDVSAMVRSVYLGKHVFAAGKKGHAENAKTWREIILKLRAKAQKTEPKEQPKNGASLKEQLAAAEVKVSKLKEAYDNEELQVSLSRKELKDIQDSLFGRSVFPHSVTIKIQRVLG